ARSVSRPQNWEPQPRWGEPESPRLQPWGRLLVRSSASRTTTTAAATTTETAAAAATAEALHLFQLLVGESGLLEDLRLLLGTGGLQPGAVLGADLLELLEERVVAASGALLGFRLGLGRIARLGRRSRRPGHHALGDRARTSD